jgi:hypothetical protein
MPKLIDYKCPECKRIEEGFDTLQLFCACKSKSGEYVETVMGKRPWPNNKAPTVGVK